jgi:predicted O-methyltransferase YrrM
LYSRFSIAIKYLNYWVLSKSIYHVHSPFLYHLIKDCLHDDRHFYAFDDLQWSKQAFRLNRTNVLLPGLGAKKSSETVMVKRVFQSIKRPFKYYRLLFNLVNYFKPETIVELGTSLGLGTMMLAAGNPNSKVYTIEGNDSLSALAAQNHKDLAYHNIKHLNGLFEEELPQLLSQIPQIDMAFIDGDHTLQSTLDYFGQMLPLCHAKSVLIFDDIHWSREMEDAWQKISADQRVTLSVDLFFMGIVFFDPALSKQHFMVRY